MKTVFIVTNAGNCPGRILGVYATERAALNHLEEDEEACMDEWDVTETNPFAGDTPVDRAELSVRTRNALIAAGLLTLGDVSRKTEAELILLPNLGKRGLKEVKTVLREAGLTGVTLL